MKPIDRLALMFALRQVVLAIKSALDDNAPRAAGIQGAAFDVLKDWHLQAEHFARGGCQ